jgi:hypothetical protein
MDLSIDLTKTVKLKDKKGCVCSTDAIEICY